MSAITGPAHRTEVPKLPHSPGNGMDDEWFLKLYKGNELVPWDTGKAQHSVVEAFEQGLFTAPVIDLGCGFGTNPIFLGSKGLEVTGIDLSPEAIAEAQTRLAAAGAPATENVSFKAGSVLDLADIFSGRKPFQSALDSALYHCLDDATQEKYLAALHKQMSSGAKLVLCAMSDRNPAENWKGPRRISEAAIRHSLREELGWRVDSVDMDTRYEVPKEVSDSVTELQAGFGWALLAVATRL
ncbi:hypothetical protein WJX81_000203 [Elliptochloris bilobata]|uniref:Methyltransferase domain-containing protein n=1 Tax=Elliptochloris bilobata TaxID=381761 RepID=A0AAW1RN70_9CHLO